MWAPTMDDVRRTIAAISARRSELARLCREVRAEWGHARAAKFLRDRDRVVSLTPGALRRAARKLRRFARTPIPTYGDEYYSACGAEDAAYDRRREAQWKADLYCAMAAYLRQVRV